MSVIIKGMKMPLGCMWESYYNNNTDYCPFCNHDDVPYCILEPSGLVCEELLFVEVDSRPEWCPLVEIPESHGRLIDADALWTDIIHRFDYCDDFLAMLENAPTVVEKE